MKKVLFICLSVSLLFGCSSQKKYTNTFSDGFLMDKVIIFTLSSESRNDIDLQGPWAGYLYSNPNATKAFKKSIEKLAEETHLNLQFRDRNTYVKSSDSEIHVDTKITAIVWTINFNSTIMQAFVSHDFPDNNIYYESIGTFKNTLGGSAQDHLYKSLKNATYSLLKELDKNNEFRTN